MAKKKRAEQSALTLASELLGVRTQIKQLTDIEKTLSSGLKEAMHSEGLREVGEYQISVARSLKISDSDSAFAWAREHNCVVPEKVDTSKAKEILRHTFDDPSKFGFAVVESERIIPKGKVDEE